MQRAHDDLRAAIAELGGESYEARPGKGQVERRPGGRRANDQPACAATPQKTL